MIAGIIGSGAWGTALGLTALRSGASVIMWSHGGGCAEFDGVEIPKELQITCDISNLAKSDVWLVATPAAYFRETMLSASEYYGNQPVIICTKGAEPKTGAFMSEILNSVIPSCRDIAILSGPQFASDVALGLPTGSAIAGTMRARDAAADVLKSLYLVHSDDIIGTQIAGIGKNAVALIAGYANVSCAGENERALIFTRAWGEVVELGLTMGADIRTFLGLAGIGDLFLSATSATSRNFAAGRDIAMGNAPSGTVEGINAISALVSRAADVGVDSAVLSQMAQKMKL